MVDEIRTKAEIFQDYMMDEFHQIIAKLKTVDNDLKVSIATHAKVEVETAILSALDTLMKPVRAEIELMINDVSTARAMLADDAIKHSKAAAAARKELLGNDIDSKHAPQEEVSMTGYYWAAGFSIITFVLGAYLMYLIKS